MNFRGASSLHYKIKSEFLQQRGDYLLKEAKAQFLRRKRGRFLLLSSDHLEEVEANVCPMLRCVIL